MQLIHFSVKEMKCAPLEQLYYITNLPSLLIIAFHMVLATLSRSTLHKFQFTLDHFILGQCNVLLPPAIQFLAPLCILADYNAAST